MNIRRKRDGDLLFTEDVNEIIDKLNGEQAQPNGLIVGNSTVQREQHKAVNRVLLAKSAAYIPPYSVFGLRGHALTPGTAEYFQVAKIGINNAGAQYALFTNDSYELPANGQGWVRPIGFNDSARLRVEGVVPSAGGVCGVHLDSFGIAADRFGFVCLDRATEHYSGSSFSTVDVLRCPDPSSLIGVVTTRITAFNKTTMRLGTGMIAVYVRRNNSRIIVPAMNPVTQAKPWIIRVYSIDTDPIDVDEVVMPHHCMGVGLVVARTSRDVTSSASDSDSSGSSSGSGSTSSSSGSSSSSSGDRTSVDVWVGGSFNSDTCQFEPCTRNISWPSSLPITLGPEECAGGSSSSV